MMKKTMLLSLVMLLLYGCALTPGQDTSAQIPSTSPTPEVSAQSPSPTPELTPDTPETTPEPTPDVPEATQVALIAIESRNTNKAHIFQVLSDMTIHYLQCTSKLLGGADLRNDDYYGAIVYDDQTIELTEEEYDDLTSLIDILNRSEEANEDIYFRLNTSTGGRHVQGVVNGKLYLSYYYSDYMGPIGVFDEPYVKNELLDLAYFLIDIMEGITDYGYEDDGAAYAWETPKSLQEKDEK